MQQESIVSGYRSEVKTYITKLMIDKFPLCICSDLVGLVLLYEPVFEFHCIFKNNGEHHIYSTTDNMTHGKYIVVSRKYKKRTECFYKNNQLHGIYRSWWDNGQLMRYNQYIHGKLHGKYIEWFHNGQMRVQYNYDNNVGYGPYIRWDYHGCVSYEVDLDYKHTKFEKIINWFSSIVV